jgi:Asp-tRNA(Asn)/Glu-tRNA(Gln) amidotransferase A subunit family amidase
MNLDTATISAVMRFVFLANFVGNPAITFPVGYDSNTMPVGMQLMGRYVMSTLYVISQHIPDGGTSTFC